MAVTIQVRRDTAANWTSHNSVLHSGEQGLETDTGKLKIGDGTTAWNSLAYEYDTAARNWSHDQHFKSGRPWFDVVAFGADPAGAADSTPAFNAAILAAVGGNLTPATTGRYALGPVYIPAGTYKITSDLLIQSVLGFRLMGAGVTSTNLMATGTGFTTAVLNIDGSLDGYYGGFEITGSGTEASGANPLPNAINLTWTTGAQRSTSANTFEHIRVRNLKFVNALTQAAPVSTSRQVDGSTLIDVVVVGAQVTGSWSNTGLYQQGFVCGNGTSANQYDYAFYNSAAVGCYYGVACYSSGFTMQGGQPAGNYCDFYTSSPGGEISVTGVQSQDAQMLITGVGGSSSNVVAFRDIIWKGHPTVPVNNYWISVNAGASAWVFDNIGCFVGSAYTPVIRLNGGGTPVTATFINLQQANTPAAGFSIAGTGSVVAINYVQMNTSNQVAQNYPLWSNNTLGIAPNVQVFTTTGTWTRPSGALSVDLVVIGPGGPGGSGRQGASGSVCGGGGGGGGGGLVAMRLQAADLVSSTATANVGTPGSAGAAVTAASTNGNAGTTGAAAFFRDAGGTTAFYCLASCGGGGQGGTTAGGGGGTLAWNGSLGGTGGASGAGGTPALFPPGGGGGGGGGGISVTPAAFNGGHGGISSQSNNQFGAAGIVDTTVPATPASPAISYEAGGGGGGGASSITTAAQSGAAGAFPGGGGGGGGASLNGNNSGAGGLGGAGVVVVITNFQ